MEGEVVFLHEVVAGAADRSYGVQVAKLAGLPSAVIDRAKVVLAELEAEDRASPTRRLADDLPLFSAAARAPAPPPQDRALAAVLEALAALNPDDLSPREALEALYRLKLMAAKREG
jgi:DNA mismatch repair protein MutS